MIVEIALNTRSLTDIARVMYYLITQFSYICKMMNIIWNRKSSLIVQSILEDPLIILQHQKEHTISRTKASVRKTAILYRVLVILVGICFFLFSFLDKETGSLLVVPAWFYIDVNEYVVEVVTYQLLSMFISGHYNVTMDIFAYSLIKLDSFEFEMLQNSISNALSLKLKKSSTTEEDAIVIERLKLCIEQHNISLRLDII